MNRVRDLASWAWGLSQSPKSREADTGAYGLRLILCKYVSHGWSFGEIFGYPFFFIIV